jgi:hypothetical protein
MAMDTRAAERRIGRSDDLEFRIGMVTAVAALWLRLLRLIRRNKKARRVLPPGMDRFLARYFAWRQEAANHHGLQL